MPEHEGRHFEIGCPGCELIEKQWRKAQTKEAREKELREAALKSFFSPKNDDSPVVDPTGGGRYA